jgi:hypothetical protein
MNAPLQSARPARNEGALILGGLLVAVGIIAYALQHLAIDPARWLGGSGWTLFIIVPGLVLLGASLLTRAAGLGLSIAGSVVTTVGLLLLYQDQAAHYESWSYAWALIAPGAIGVGTLVHGVRFGRSDLVTLGTRLIAASLVLLLALGWYFESIFESGRVPFSIGENWPVVAVVLGAAVIAFAVFRGRGRAPDENL